MAGGDTSCGVSARAKPARATTRLSVGDRLFEKGIAMGVFKVLANHTRLRILYVLVRKGELCQRFATQDILIYFSVTEVESLSAGRQIK